MPLPEKMRRGRRYHPVATRRRHYFRLSLRDLFELLHFFHHQHFNRLAAGHQFEAELVEQGLL